MNVYFITIYTMCIIVIQIFISLNLLGNIDLDRLAKKYPFIKKKIVRGKIVGFTRGYFWRGSNCRGDYLIVVSTLIGNELYETKLVRAESDEIGKEIYIIAYNNRFSIAGRFGREVPYMKKNGLKLINYYLVMWTFCCVCILFIFHKFTSVFLMVLLGQLFLNYLMTPLYLSVRNKTW